MLNWLKRIWKSIAEANKLVSLEERIMQLKKEFPEKTEDDLLDIIEDENKDNPMALCLMNALRAKTRETKDDI